ncbi:hypothetical protein FSP39_004131 [Pinctada imbricata]|uniref:15-hydroxyprostaglandin dehydrogenase [NAD(+)] n=1 Tax=Pinctada imbricata TaxID=66713 RepID=A0AA88Y8Y7_PINIB|nr:hypothetical protein FSP39_004131 [Pinctada imbricata]
MKPRSTGRNTLRRLAVPLSEVFKVLHLKPSVDIMPQVCLSDVNPHILESTCTELREKYGQDKVHYQVCDVRDDAQVEDLFSKAKSSFSKLDLVVNNAGVVDEQDWLKCIDINLNGVIRGSLQGIKHMKKENGGSGGTIVNVASLAGVVPVSYSPAYAASKHGVVGYTRSWAGHPDMKTNDIRFLCLCPAFAKTEILKTKEGQLLGQKMAEEFMKKTGVMSVDQVTQAFTDLIETPDNSGSVMSVTLQGSKLLFQV